MGKTISLIIPCYNEEEAIHYLYEELNKVIHTMKEEEFELIFIDDGSDDGTLQKLRSLAAEDARVKFLSFSRNFGKEAAIYAGLESSTGDYVAIMDADLQDPPSLLPELFHAVSVEGYDSAATRRVTRKGEPPIRSFFARVFYKIINKMTNVDIVDGARDFRLMNRKFVHGLLELKEYNRFSKGLFGWVGYHTKWVEFENVERVAGETKWSFWKLFKYSIEGIIAFTTMPLVISSFLGFFICLLAIIAMGFVVVRYLLYGDPVSGWPSLVCIMMFLSGIQLFLIGVQGQYLGKMYMEIKRRPLYLVAEDNISSNG